MKAFINLLSVLALSFMLNLSFTSCDKIEFNNSLSESFKLAKEQNKKVLVILSKEGCGKCNKLVKKLNSPFFPNRSTIIDDYVSCKISYNSKEGKEFAMLSNATFYPFTAVFDSDVNMQALMLGEDEYEYDKPSLNELDEYVFREMFNYGMSYDKYKKQLSYSMQSWLMQQQSNGDSIKLKQAYELIKQSIELQSTIANLTFAHSLSLDVDKESTETYAKHIKDVYSLRDDILYEEYLRSFGIEINRKKLRESQLVNNEFSLESSSINMGEIKEGKAYKFSFNISNTGKEALIINNVRKTCSCVDISWPKEPIMPGEKGLIEGVVKRKSKGNFTQLVFVHLNSKQHPLAKVFVRGIAI